MIRWLKIPIETFYTNKVKMYRPLYESSDTRTVEFIPFRGMDRYAKDHLGSELFNYKIMDTNKIKIAECLGDLDNISTIEVPID